MNWQPIATAPKDGSEIIGTDGEHVGTIRWCSQSNIRAWLWLNCAGGVDPPTHWKPKDLT